MTIKKINFSALNTQNTEKKIEEKKEFSPPEIKKQEETKTKPIVQVSLGKKKDVILTEKTEIKVEEEKVEKPNNNPSPSGLPLKSEDKEIEKTEEIKIGGEKLIKEPESLFNNYESDFSSKQETIIEKLKKLKNLPKTRPKLVYSMLGVLILGVSGIIFISPNDSYIKASILGTEQKQVVSTKNNLSEIAKKKSIETQKKLEKENQEKIKKEKLEEFLLNKNKNSNKIPIKTNTDIKNKSKNKKLKDLLLEAKKNK